MQAQAPVLSTRILPRTRVSIAVLVVGFAALTALAAQIRIPLGFTPVPLTGQTFAVLLSGAVLGLRAGAAAQALYVAAGLAGFPVFQGGEGGWSYATGATAGYLLGFIVSAAAVGYLAEQQQDRRVTTAIPAMLAGNTLIYLCGVPWLMHVLGTDLAGGLTAGFAPFVVGDLLKIAAAGLFLPAVWRLFGER
ncbi:MAG TPA: biotin transporter BioY [Acidimicrobiia bacterium]|nr:biotin transporter BioY [Acidimicrobiia bacterium]